MADGDGGTMREHVGAMARRAARSAGCTCDCTIEFVPLASGITDVVLGHDDSCRLLLALRGREGRN